MHIEWVNASIFVKYKSINFRENCVNMTSTECTNLSLHGKSTFTQILAIKWQGVFNSSRNLLSECFWYRQLFWVIWFWTCCAMCDYDELRLLRLICKPWFKLCNANNIENTHTCNLQQNKQSKQREKTDLPVAHTSCAVAVTVAVTVYMLRLRFLHRSRELSMCLWNKMWRKGSQLSRDIKSWYNWKNTAFSYEPLHSPCDSALAFSLDYNCCDQCFVHFFFGCFIKFNSFSFSWKVDVRQQKKSRVYSNRVHTHNTQRE